ncbi:MAG: hypothetical protein KGD63_13045 [Candidatus Lokiarchaeota archaeon]|nr:hypothetical protein [Candidatus Lokiarchaeota archaeon]
MYQKLNQYDCTLESYNSIQSKLTNEFQQTLSKKKVFLAIDGYIDSLYSVIKTRENSNNYTEFKTIKELADRLYRIQGSSGNLEIKLKKKTSGGFVPNNGKALSTLNINVSLFGALGYPEICDIFKPMITKKNIDLFSYNNPAKTVGLEFNDGKIMLSDFQNLSHIKWGLITDRVGSDMIFHKLEDSDAIGFGYWSLNPALSNIWKNLTDTIFPSIKDLNKKLFFIDLGDLKKCTKPNILEMVKIVQNIEKQIPVLLSLNDQEAIDLSSILKCKTPIKPNKNSFMDFIDAGELLNKELKLSYLVIHSPHFATISLKKK